MSINTYGVDLDVMRRDYKDMNEFFGELLNAAKDEETEWAVQKHYQDILGNYVANAFNVDKETFLREAYEELCPLMGCKVGEFMTTPLTILHLKLGDILGTENPDIIEIYARRSPKH